MISPTKTNDNFSTSKKLMNGLHRYPKVVKSKNPALTGIIPEGYKTSDDFWKQIDEKIDNLCKEHGLL